MATNIGPLVKRLRERYRLTQQEVVDYAHLDRSSSYISAIETGKTSPTLFELERIAQSFRTTAVDMILEAQEGESEETANDDDKILSLFQKLSEEKKSLAFDFLTFLSERVER